MSGRSPILQGVGVMLVLLAVVGILAAAHYPGDADGCASRCDPQRPTIAGRHGQRQPRPFDHEALAVQRHYLDLDLQSELDRLEQLRSQHLAASTLLRRLSSTRRDSRQMTGSGQCLGQLRRDGRPAESSALG
jgi:hypothetical protein